MKTTRAIVLTIVALMSAAHAQAQSQKDAVKQIDALLTQYHDYGKLNGTVLVAEKGKVIYEKGFGLANMEWNIPNQTDTKFRIGSVTKQFTAALILQLVEEGKIKLDGKLSDYLPDYRKDTGSRVTIHHLLNHTSGIPSYTRGEFAQKYSRDPQTVPNFVKNFMSGDLEFEPGSKYVYNNSGYGLLGAIIEKVTGKSYETVLTERILKPLGMTNTGYDHHETVLAKRASGYQKAPAGFINAAYLDMSLPYAAGSMYSTVDDLYKWETALYEGSVLKPETRTLMFTPGLSNYGYGLAIAEYPVGKTEVKLKTIGHGGGINGFNCLITRAIDQRQTVIILDNVGFGQFHERITGSIFSILNGQPAEMPLRSVADTLSRIVLDKNVAAAIAEYRRLKTSNAPTYDFAESELNNLGYQLLRMNRLKDAIEIFKLNVEMFPAADNPYDSLGEAYLADGQKELALTNYRRAVELRPSNANAARIVAQLEGKEVKVDPSGFDAYVGDYQVLPQLVLTITREGDKLFGQATGQQKFELEPVSEKEFTISVVKANLTFERDASGKVTGLTLVQGGQTLKSPKIR